MLKLFVALSMLACSVITLGPSNGVLQVINSNVKGNKDQQNVTKSIGALQLNFVSQAFKSNDKKRIDGAKYAYDKPYDVAKISPVVVVDEVVKGYNYTKDAIFEFYRLFATDKYNSKDGFHYDIIKRLGQKYGGFWGGLVGLSEKPGHSYSGLDLVKSSEPDHYQIVMHRGSFVLYLYRIKLMKPAVNVTKAPNERKAIPAEALLNGVPQVNNSNVKIIQEYEYNKVFAKAKASPVVVIDQVNRGNNNTNYTNDVIKEFNKVFAADKIKSHDGIHYDVIRGLGDKFGGFWGGFVALSDLPRKFHFDFDVHLNKWTRLPYHYHILMHKGSVVLHVYYFKFEKPIDNVNPTLVKASG